MFLPHRLNEIPSQFELAHQLGNKLYAGLER